MGRIEEINALGDKMLNEWGINNAKNLGLQACTMAIEALIEFDRLRAERDAAIKAFQYHLSRDIPEADLDGVMKLEMSVYQEEQNGQD